MAEGKTPEEKLKLFADEVRKMREYQAKYFKAVVGSTEKRDWLNASMKQEKIVDRLVKKVLDNQAQLPL